MNIVSVETPVYYGLLGVPYTREASSPRTTDLLCAAALFINARTVVEAGTFAGHTAFALAAALRDTDSSAHVWTADSIDRYPDGIHENAIIPLRLQETLTFFLGDFVDMLEQVKDMIDLAYIDASAKDKPHLRKEHYMAVWPRMRRGGLVFVDDCAGIWTDAEADAQWFREQATIYFPYNRGLALFCKS